MSEGRLDHEEEAARRFNQAMLRGYERLKTEIGYNARRFRQMVGELGGVEAAKALLRGPNVSDGFTRLWEAGRLELSVEFFVLLPEYEPLFSTAEHEIARARLEDHEFDVDAGVRRHAEDARIP